MEEWKRGFNFETRQRIKRLKACPHCGGEAMFIRYLGNAYGQYRVKCCDDKCHRGTHEFDTIEEALRAWNKRKP